MASFYLQPIWKPVCVCVCVGGGGGGMDGGWGRILEMEENNKQWHYRSSFFFQVCDTWEAQESS